MRKFGKILSLILVVAMLVQLFPAAVFAEESNTTYPGDIDVIGLAEASGETLEEALKNAKILFEEEELREEKVKHFRLDNGSYIAVQYGSPVHYEENGEWVDYDNTLREVSAFDETGISYYTVTNGDSTRVFAADANAEVLLALQKGNYSLSLTPVNEPDADIPVTPIPPVEMEIMGGDIGSEGDMQADQNAVISSENIQPAQPATVLCYSGSGEAETYALPAEEASLYAQAQPEAMYSALEYVEALNGATLRYENYGNTVKESIVIHEPRETYSYSFTLETEGLTPTLREDGSISLTAPDGQIIYTIPAPYMIDANSETSLSATYHLSGAENNYTLTVVADDQWLNDPNRAYPVVLDPSVVESSNGDEDISATFVREGSGTNSWHANYPDPDRTGLYAGSLGITSENQNGLTRSYFHINNYIDLPANCEIVWAGLCMFQFHYDKQSGGSDSLELGIYSLDKADGLTVNTNDTAAWSQWASSLTWNDVENTNKTVRNPNLVDKQVLSTNTVSATDPVIWNITTMAFDWYQEIEKNLGFVLMATDEAAVSSRASFYSPNVNNGKTPAMAIIYRNTVGIEPYYTYRTVDAGAAGIVHIGDFTMQATLELPLVSSPSSVMPAGLSLIYNSAYEQKQFGEDESLHTKPFTTMRFGAGWKLSAQETIIKKTDKDNPTTPDDYYLIHTDGDGTEHYYYYDDESSSETELFYTDEDGLGLKIQDCSPDFYMTSEYGDECYFGNGYLKWVTDAYGNKISYNYLGTQQLGSIVRQNVGGEEETIATLSYYSETEAYPYFLKSVKDEADRETTFSYSTIQGVHCLTAVTFQDGTQARYNYMDDHRFYRKARMNSAYDSERNYGIEFSYSYSRDIRNIYEFVLQDTSNSESKIYGAKMHGYKRSRSQAVYRYYGDDGIPQAQKEEGDDLLSFMIFDAFGRTVSNFTTDYSESTVIGAGTASYTQNTGTAKTNNRLTNAATSGQQGMNLLFNGDGEKGLDGWTGGSSATNDVLFGTRSFLVTGNELSQSINLTAETEYTFSAYVKVPENASAYLSVVGDTEPYNSRVVDYPTEGPNQGWQRISVCFTPAATKAYTVKVITSGAVYVDALQLEKGDAPTTYNLLDESSFEDVVLSETTDEDRWNSAPGTWYYIGEADIVGNDPFDFGSHALSVSGNGARNHVMQHVDMDCDAGTVFVVSAWAKASADPDGVTKKGTESDIYFGLFVRLRYADNTEEVQFVSFDPLYHDWQYCQGVIAPKKENVHKDITDIIVALAYDNNFNSALFDNISLRMEPAQSYYYDEEGKLISAAQAGSGNDDAEYHENGVDILQYCSANGTTFSYTYNDQHDVLTQTSDGVTASYDYSDTGNVVYSSLVGRTEDNKILTMEARAEYTDDSNHIAVAIDTAKNTTQYEYDQRTELLTKVTDAKNYVVEYSYNEDNDRPATTTYRGENGQILGTIDYTYSNGLLSSLSRSYNRNGASKSQNYSFGYNIWGQATSTKVGTITLASYTYEDLPGAPVGSGGGNRMEMLYGNGSSVNYEYDELDRKIKTLYNDTGDYIIYRYNAEGSLSECVYMDSDDDVISGYTFEYDSLGRQIRSAEYDSEGSIVQSVEQIYDSIGRLSTQTWTVGDDTYSEGYHYNDPDPNEESPTGDGALSQVDAATGDQIAYSYDELKRPLSVEIRDPEGTIRFRTAYDYEIKEGLETGLVKYRNVRRADGTLIDGYMYEYDALGNIIGIYESEVAEGCTERRPLALYEYDAQSQLISEIRYTYTVGRDGTIRTQTEGYTYTYDTAGNIIKKQAVKNGLNSSETKYSYNNDQWQDLLTAYDGELILYEGQHIERQTNPRTGIVTVSVEGNPTSGNPIHYYNGTHYDMAWQQGRNLVENSFETQDHSSSNQLYWVETENEIGYTYDADGIRTSKTVVIDTYRYKSSSGSAVASVTSLTPIEPFPEETYTRFLSGSKTVIHNYVNQNGKVVRETIGEGAATEVLDFIYDSAGNPFALIYTNGTAESVTYYYILNYQGDVIKLLDDTGAEVANYQYDAWGKVVKATGGMAEVNPLRYRGYYYDLETGLYYVSSRYYDPEIGRFLNADDVDLLGANGDFASFNLFAYCGNNPVSRADSNGYFWNTIIGTVAGAIVGGVSALVLGTDIAAGIVSGAISGAISGAAVDIAIATGGVGLVALAAVSLVSGAGGAASSYVNQRMNGKSHDEVDWGTVVIDGVWGAVGGALSFGTADVGGKMCKTLAENLALKGKAFWSQVGSDFATTIIITAGTWLNGTKMNLLRESK